MKTRALRLALPLLALLSCRDNRVPIQVQSICAPTADCSFGATCDKHPLSFPIVDSAGPGALKLVLQVANQLKSNEDAARGRLNTQDAHLDQVAVEYEQIPLGTDVYDLPNFTIPTAGTAVVSVWLVRSSAATRAALAAYAPNATGRPFVANLRLRGYYDDGSRFETGQFPVGVYACTGCLPTNPCPGGVACPAVGMEPVACGTTSG